MKIVVVIAMVVAVLAECPVEKRAAKRSPNGGIVLQPPVTDEELAAARARRAWSMREATQPRRPARATFARASTKLSWAPT
jgi:hypothetical protein